MSLAEQSKFEPLPSQHFIDGQWRASHSGARMETFDPGRAEAHAEFAAGNADDVSEAVASAKRAGQGEWRGMTPAERGRILSVEQRQR